MPVDIESLIPFRVNDGEYSVNLPLTHLKQGLQGMSPDGHTPIVVPDYQRGRVWTADQQCAYIEAKLCKNINLHFDVIRLNCPLWGGRDEPVIGLDPNVLELVDGLQRLTACMVFMQDQLPVLGGYVASDLTNYRMHTSFTIQVNTLPTRALVLQWYLQLNSTGTPHTSEELGRVRDLLAQEQAALRGGSQ